MATGDIPQYYCPEEAKNNGHRPQCMGPGCPAFDAAEAVRGIQLTLVPTQQAGENARRLHGALAPGSCPKIGNVNPPTP